MQHLFTLRMHTYKVPEGITTHGQSPSRASGQARLVLHGGNPTKQWVHSGWAYWQAEPTLHRGKLATKKVFDILLSQIWMEESNHPWNQLYLWLFWLYDAMISFHYLSLSDLGVLLPMTKSMLQVRTVFIPFTAVSPRPSMVRNTKQTIKE
jgi:hypothetical protein